MKTERKRIFISNLPEVASESEIQKTFSDYGKIVSIEIKERKELSTKHSSHFFAYVNIETDDKTLQQCFKDFANEKWLGQYVYLQLARESFLDRLKREREENATAKPKVPETNEVEISRIVNRVQTNDSKAASVKHVESSDSSEDEAVSKPILKQTNGLKSVKSNESSEESSDSSEDEAVTKAPTPQMKSENVNVKKEVVKSEEFDSIYDSDIVIKNNKNKTLHTDGLKIESVGKEPIVKIEKTKPKAVKNTSEANLKRLESLKNLKKGYQNQKSLIQAALSTVDTKINNKIVFDNDVNQPSKKRKVDGENKKSLFDEDSDGEQFEGNFNVKEQFQGRDGEKLLALQSKYKNDKRFQLDSRFLDSNNENVNSHMEVDENEEMTVEDEVRREYEILNEVLGKKFTPKLDNKVESQKKTMLRFDPTLPDHSKFEVQRNVGEIKKKRNKKNMADESLEAKKHEETSTPEVSKEVFYKVHDALKESLLEKKQEFSLLNLFGTATNEKESVDEAEEVNEINNSGLPKEKNPFRYDSSDDEDETENIPTHENSEQVNVDNNLEGSSTLPRKNFWVEPFFFGKDDYRLQEGYDFLEKIKCEDKGEFRKLRRDIKEIVKAKVRNNQRKNKPFKKKLGGNRKKKVLRMKKALKR